MRYYFLWLLIMPVAVSAQQRVAVPSAPDSIKIKNYLEISKAYALTQPDSAVDYCNRAIRIAEKLNDRYSTAILLLQMGRINALHNHTDLARKFDNEALSVFRSLHDQQGIASAYDELGLIDGKQQDINSAAKDIGQAMTFYKDANDSLGILQTYYNLGSVYEEKGDTEKALTYYLKAIIQYEQRKIKPVAYFVMLDRIGHIYQQKGDNAKAIKYYEEGVKQSNIPVLKDTQVNLLDEEGKVYEQDGDKNSALNRYKLELDIARKFNLPEDQAKALISIAGVLKKENASQSLSDLKRALAIAGNLHEAKLEAAIYSALAGIYRQQKNYKEAIVALEESHRLVDSLLGADTAKDIAELDSSYKLESSREQIGHLKHETRQERKELNFGVFALVVLIAFLILLWLYLRKVSRLNRELKASNKIKDTLFSIIGHDLKGPAGSATQMFDLIEAGELTDEELKLMLTELKKQTNASFELLNSLFEWGRAQLNGVKVQPEIVDVKQIIQKNIILLSQQAQVKDIGIADHTDGAMKVFADPNQVDFIMRNLLSNAIKFSFEHGKINITASTQNHEIIFAVKDNGVGISAEQVQLFQKSNLAVTFGTKGEKGSGLGLLLIKEFIKANNGRIWLQSKKGEGADFYFSLPVS